MKKTNKGEINVCVSATKNGSIIDACAGLFVLFKGVSHLIADHTVLVTWSSLAELV